MEGRLKEKVPASVAHLVQRFGPVLSASALRTPNETCKVRNAPTSPSVSPVVSPTENPAPALEGVMPGSRYRTQDSPTGQWPPIVANYVLIV